MASGMVTEAGQGTINGAGWMQTGYKVLNIDDDSVVHKIVARALQDKYEIITASNGYEGILKAKEEQPDVISLMLKCQV